MREHEGAHKKSENSESASSVVNETPNEYSELFEDTLPEDTGKDKIDNHTWGKIVLETERMFPPLIGQLTGSSARISGNYIHITLGERNLKLFINEQMLGKFVSQAALTVMGKNFNVKID